MHEDTRQRGLLFDFPPPDSGVFLNNINYNLCCPHLWMTSVMKVKMSSSSFIHPEKLPNISPTPAIVVTVTASGLV